jgi:hypothetical protein
VCRGTDGQVGQNRSEPNGMVTGSDNRKQNWELVLKGIKPKDAGNRELGCVRWQDRIMLFVIGVGWYEHGESFMTKSEVRTKAEWERVIHLCAVRVTRDYHSCKQYIRRIFKINAGPRRMNYIICGSNVSVRPFTKKRQGRKQTLL